MADDTGPVESPVSGDDPPAVRAECQAEDGRIATAGIGQAELFLAGGCVQDDQVRGVARGDPAAVGTEGDAPEAAGDVGMGEDLLAGRHVPNDQVPFQGRLVEVNAPDTEATRVPSGLNATPLSVCPDWRKVPRSR